MYQQVYDPIAHSLGLTSVFAAIPLTLMFIMLGVFKRSPQLSALVSLLATLARSTDRPKNKRQSRPKSGQAVLSQ
jgi:hypothetical protein